MIQHVTVRFPNIICQAIFAKFVEFKEILILLRLSEKHETRIIQSCEIKGFGGVKKSDMNRWLVLVGAIASVVGLGLNIAFDFRKYALGFNVYGTTLMGLWAVTFVVVILGLFLSGGWTASIPRREIAKKEPAQQQQQQQQKETKSVPQTA